MTETPFDGVVESMCHAVEVECIRIGISRAGGWAEFHRAVDAIEQEVGRERANDRGEHGQKW